MRTLPLSPLPMGMGPPPFLVIHEAGGRQRVVDNRHAVLRWDLERRHVSPSIIERIIRLNPTSTLDQGRVLRGLNYKPGRWYGLPRGLVQKGEIIRRHGLEVWARIPRDCWVKDGRRIWVSYRDVDRATRQEP